MKLMFFRLNTAKVHLRSSMGKGSPIRSICCENDPLLNIHHHSLHTAKQKDRTISLHITPKKDTYIPNLYSQPKTIKNFPIPKKDTKKPRRLFNPFFSKPPSHFSGRSLDVLDDSWESPLNRPCPSWRPSR